MSARLLIEEAEANGVRFFIDDNKLRYSGDLPEALFAAMWRHREEVRSLVEKMDVRCWQCRTEPLPTEIGGYDAKGWCCERCLRSYPVGRYVEPPAPDDGPRPRWTDDQEWIRLMRWAADPAAVLAEWLSAAGGRREDGVAVLPPLPHRLAKLELYRMLKQAGLAVRERAHDPRPVVTPPSNPANPPVLTAPSGQQSGSSRFPVRKESRYG
jgi:hypothetical protein